MSEQLIERMQAELALADKKDPARAMATIYEKPISEYEQAVVRLILCERAVKEATAREARGHEDKGLAELRKDLEEATRQVEKMRHDLSQIKDVASASAKMSSTSSPKHAWSSPRSRTQLDEDPTVAALGITRREYEMLPEHQQYARTRVRTLTLCCHR